jgi:hypothetical protein
MLRKAIPGLSLPVGDRVRRLGQTSICETAACDADLFGKRRCEPEERGATDHAEVALLVLVLRRVVKRIDVRFARALHYGGFLEVGRDPECATRSALAVGAVADAMHGGQCVHRDGGLAAGACCCHLWAFEI